MRFGSLSKSLRAVRPTSEPRVAHGVSRPRRPHDLTPLPDAYDDFAAGLTFLGLHAPFNGVARNEGIAMTRHPIKPFQRSSFRSLDEAVQCVIGSRARGNRKLARHSRASTNVKKLRRVLRKEFADAA